MEPARRRVLGRFQVIKHALLTHDARRERRAGRNILRLRWPARLARFEDLRRGIRIAEATVARRVFERCEPASDDVGLAARAACLGRAVDELRCYGYLGILDQAPDVAAELARAGTIAERVTSLTQRYQLLVGATFGDPGNIALRRRLIATRRILETYPPLPIFAP